MNAELSAAQMAELTALVEALLDERITSDDAARLDQYIRRDEAARWVYVQYANLYAGLRWDRGSRRDPHADNEPPHVATPVSAPIQGFLGDTTPGTLSLFAGSWALAYLIATVTLGLGLLIGSLTPVSDPIPIAHKRLSPAESPRQPDAAPVGLITGMVDCQFAEGSRFRVQGSGRRGDGSELPSPAGRGAGGEGVAGSQSPIPHPQSLVHLGDTFALASGLMEITYDTGAKVILQGPVTYEVESKAGGFLSLGKLSARVEKKVESSSPQSLIPNPSSLSTNHYPLFTIKTPTATVTDLGTEFGVEVSKEGLTTSHVFRGAVRMQVAATDGRSEGVVQVLRENQSARIEGRDGKQAIVLISAPKPAAFAREIPRLTVKSLDLVDVVAGGDGFSGRRNRGIDARNGRAADTLTSENPMFGDGKYHRVAGMPFLDGVFIPHGGSGPVQLDSAGHAFDDFPATDNKACNYIWAGKVDIDSAELDGIDYASPGHGHLALDANKGITFDLEAIRRANADFKLVRFLAMAGNTEQVSEKGEPVYADVWVFVDGQVQFRRREITRYNGAMPIMIPIHDNDRFLTLASTDGGNGYNQDHIMFGDPRLELVPAKATADATPPREAAEH